MSLFEAARWAPYNNQPWRFICVKRNTLHWNKVWTENGTLLVAVVSRKNFKYNERYSITHQYDTGAAWENLALEASSRGLVAHGCKDSIMRGLELI